MAEVEWKLGHQEVLHRSLSTRDLVIYGLMFVAPVAPFSLFGIIWAGAGGMVPLVYLVAFVSMIFTATSYATMSRAFPSAGSVYTYVQQGLGDFAGFIAGWLILLDYILVPALLYVISTLALKALAPEIPQVVTLAILVSFNTVINVRGVKFGAKLNRFTLVMQLASLTMFLGLGLYALYFGAGSGAMTLAPFYNPSAFSVTAIIGATSIAVMSFLGFDGISTLAEENKSGVKSIGRAMIITLAIVGFLFVFQTWVAAELSQGSHFIEPELAIYQLAQTVGGTPLRLLIAGMTVISAGLGGAAVAQAAVARILFAMARDKKLPTILARVHSQYKTPHVSTIFVAVVSFVIGWAYSTGLDNLSRLVNFGALSALMLLHVAVINYFFIRMRERKITLHLVFPILGLIILAYILFHLDRVAQIIGLCWILVGLAYYVVLGLKGRARLPSEF